jgi:hypothetical protein
MTIDNPTKQPGPRPPSHGVDLPGYQRRQAITPAAAPVGFSQAVEGVAKSNEIIGAMGTKIAVNASEQRAELQGIKYAQENPGAEIGFALTATDKIFTDAARLEKHKVLSNQAANIADKINLEYSRILNPTGKDLELYQRDMTDALGDILAMSDPKTKGDLSRSLEQTVNSGVSQLAIKVENANIQRLKDTATVSSKNNLTNILDYYRLGMNEAARDAYEQELVNIQSSRGLFGEAATKTKMDALELTRDVGIYGGVMQQIQEYQGTEEAAKYFRNFVENRPDDMTPTRHQEVSKELYGIQSNYLKQLGIDQSIEYSGAQLELVQTEGLLAPDRWQDLKAKVSPEQYNNLQIKSLQLQQSKTQLDEDMNFVLANGRNVVAMSNMSSDRVNKVFDGFMKQAEKMAAANGVMFNPILDGANIAANIAAPITKYKGLLEDAILFADADQAAQAGEAIRMLEKDNPIALLGMNKDAKDISTLFNSYRLNTAYTGAEALAQAKNDIYNISDEERLRREEIFKSNIKQYDKTPEKWADHIAKGLDAPKSRFIFGKYMMPPDLPVKAKALLESYVVRFGNYATAEKQMFKDLGDVYKVTTTNNRKELMAYPPEVALKDVNIGNWSDNDKALSLYRFVKQNQAGIERPNSFIFNKIDWPDNPFDQYMQIDGEPIKFNANGTMSAGGRLITAQEFYNAMPDALVLDQMVKGNMELMVDGVKRKVIIKSDEITQLSGDMMPSWAFVYLDDNGVQMPLMGIDKSGGDVRWYPSYGLLDTFKAKIPQWQQDEANIQRQIALNAREEYLNSIEANASGLSDKTKAITSSLYGDDLL